MFDFDFMLNWWVFGNPWQTEEKPKQEIMVDKTDAFEEDE